MSGASWIRLGAILGGLGVVTGAFGAHGLEGKLTGRGPEIYETAARYQMYHALAMLAVGFLGLQRPSGSALSVAGWSFLIGIALFSGSLYALALSGIRWLGMITPIGGLAFIVGWVALAIAASSGDKPTGVEL